MKHLLVLLVISCTTMYTGNVFAKENKDLAKANYYYSHYDFHKAIPCYEKIADQINDPAIYAKLGDCYRQTENPDKAAAMYDKAVKTKGCEVSVMLRYGQVLMALTRYTDAEKWLKQYQKYNKGDRRVANLIAGCSDAEMMRNGIPSGFTTFLSINSEGSEFAPTMWNGKLVFTSDTGIDIKKKTDNWSGKAYYNMYSVSCDNKGNCDTIIGLVASAKKLNIKYHNGPSTFSTDGTQMYYTRSKYNDNVFGRKSVTNTDSTVLLEIMIASEYDSSRKEFRKFTPFEYNSDKYSVAHATISPNGKMLVFSSNMPKGAGGSDLYLCKLTAANSWSAPQSAGNNINTEGEEVFPYWADDHTLFFSSDGHEGMGGLDVYKTHFDDKSGSFSKVENVGAPINSSYDDISLAMYADGRSTYFSSNRPAEKGGDNIYFYRREKVFLQMNFKDSASQQPVAGARVMLRASKDKQESRADNSGRVFTQLYPEDQYTLDISKDQYEPKSIMLSSASGKELDTIISNVSLVKIPTVDTTPAIAKHESPMDSPGVKAFVVDKVYELGHFYYDYDKYQLTSAHKRFLDTLLTQLTRHPEMRIEIQSHTDCRGSDKYNKVLSKRRALSVVNYLEDHGISKKRLEYVGFGSSKPTVLCQPTCKSCTEEQHYLNRILEFRVLHL